MRRVLGDEGSRLIRLVNVSILKCYKITPNGRWVMDMFDVLWVIFVMVLSFGIGLFTKYVL